MRTMQIAELVNHYWPDTIAKLALTQGALPEGLPFMGAFVEVFPGKNLPVESEVEAKRVEYETLCTRHEEDEGIKKQIRELELTQTPRRLREAIGDARWMTDLDAQITSLRNQLSRG